MLQNNTRKKGYYLKFCIAFMLLTGTTIIALSQGVLSVYGMAYSSTHTDTLDDQGSLIFYEIEYEISAEDFPDIPEYVAETDFIRGTKQIDWTVPANSTTRSTYFSVSSGSTITVMVSCAPTDKTMKIGIIEPDGNRRYVNSSAGIVSYSFNVNKSGSHAVYAHNENSTSVTVIGVYVY